MPRTKYDYVVVGAGSAGCIVASRLAAVHSVLLLECGEPAESNPETLSADGFKDAFANDRVMCGRMSRRQRHCGSRSLYLGTGTGMGGSGSVNGMVYTRGDQRDYECWPAGWQWDDLVPSFQAVEQRLGVQPRPPTLFAERFMDAAVQAGFRRKDGMNDGNLGGVIGCNDMNYSGQERRSSYAGFIKDSKPENLEIRTSCQVRKVEFDSAHNATAVQVDSGDGRVSRIAVGRELVLCAGALETPQILLRSGIGPVEQLKSAGVDTVLDAPGIGRNLQDHPNVCLFFKADTEIDFSYPQVYGFGAVQGHTVTDAAPDTCFVCYAAPASIRESMLRMLPILALPGSLYRIVPLRRLLRGMVKLAFRVPLLQRYVSNIFGVVVILGKPTSRGELRIISPDPDVPAKIDPGYYKTVEDRSRVVAGIRAAAHITAQHSLADVNTRPLSAAAKKVSEKKLWKWIHSATMTTFHFCGTCSMGEGQDSPVSPDLRVKGLGNVRVADASVIPEIPVSALNAPSMMIGWRAADFILNQEVTSEMLSNEAAA